MYTLHTHRHIYIYVYIYIYIYIYTSLSLQNNIYIYIYRIVPKPFRFLSQLRGVLLVLLVHVLLDNASSLSPSLSLSLPRSLSPSLALPLFISYHRERERDGIIRTS